ncbi:hypothetical protein D2M30_1098 [Bacillus amyloliquefaciens]|nr:hypothetical protein D2M30_1098 [Bacillus amyloliquefaciens]
MSFPHSSHFLTGKFLKKSDIFSNIPIPLSLFCLYIVL